MGNCCLRVPICPDDVPIYAKGAYTWNENLPENGVVTIKQVLIRVEARKTLRLYELYFGQEPEEEPEEGDPAAAEEGAADGIGPRIRSWLPAGWRRRMQRIRNQT